MKLIVAALAAAFSFSAYAITCTVDLTNGYSTIRTYRSSAYARNEACRDALRECNRDRMSYGSNYRCDTRDVGNDPYPNPGYESCTYQLQDRYGFRVNSFTSSSYYRYEACNSARSQCESERSYRSSRGFYGDSCVEDYYNNPTPPPSQGYSASCSAELRSSYGSRLAVITEQAFGQSYAQAQGNACAEALRTCRLRAAPGQTCRNMN